MAQLIYSSRALSDFERLTDFLSEVEPAAAAQTAELIIEAAQILENHTEIGRPAEQGLRDLIISRGRSGYIALYSYDPDQEVVLLLTIRHQREIGYVSE